MRRARLFIGNKLAHLDGCNGQELFVDQPRARHAPVKRRPPFTEQIANAEIPMQQLDHSQQVDRLTLTRNHNLHARTSRRSLEPRRSGRRSYDDRIHVLAIEATIVGQVDVTGAADKNVLLSRTPQLPTQVAQCGIHDPKNRTTFFLPTQIGFVDQRVDADQHRIRMSAQQVHEPAVFRRLRDIRPRGVIAAERHDAIERLHEVGVDPGTISRRFGKSQLSV